MKIHKLILGLMLVPLLVFGTVSAQTDPDTSTNDTDTSTTDSAKAKEELQARLEKRKARRQSRLDAARELRLKTVCQGVQGKLQAVEARVQGVQRRRTTVYTSLLERLENLGERLKLAGVDTTEYDKQVAELSTKVNTFSQHLEEYSQAVSDMVGMDCAADPEAFQASLEAARTARAELIKEAKEIRTYLTGTIKPTLVSIRQKLNADGGEGN